MNPSTIRKGIIVFISITLIAFAGLLIYSNTGQVFDAFKNIHLKYILLSMVLALLDWWLGGIRNHIFARQIKKGLTQKACFDANLANVFVGAITPSQTGGAPAQWYILNRYGIKIVDSIAISIMNYVSTVIFFVISGAFALTYTAQLIANDLLQTLISSAFFIFTGGLIVIILSVVIPKRMGSFFVNLAVKIQNIFSLKEDKLKKKADQFSLELINYHDTMMIFIRKKPHLMILSFVVTSILYLNKYTLAFVLLLGLGIEADYYAVISIQALIFFIIYFAPSPGGSGVAEISIAVLMGQIIADSKLASFTILHRSFLLLIPALIGAFIILAELKKQTAKESKEVLKETKTA